MICIPTSFELGGREWRVEVVPLVDNEPDTYGDCDGAECVIRLKAGMSPDLMYHTFLHEYVHAVCFTLGWEKLNADEGKVDALANVFFQYLKTKKGKLQ
jgi:hypothetical protein